MQPAYIVIKVILIGFTLAANAYYLLSIVAGFKFFSRPQEKEGGELLPVAIMIPLHGADFKAYDNYARLCRQDYPQYQIVFGVREARDTSVPIVKQLIADFPERDISLSISANTIGTNMKVSNLQNMLEHVKYEQI